MDLIKAHFSNIFDYATEQARTIVYLNYVDLAICIAILLTVVGLMTFAVIKFRYREGDSDPVEKPDNLKLEITWTVIPALILLFLGILTGVVMHMINPPAGKRLPDVIVNAHQWWWEYRYPKLGVVTANELYLPEGINSLLEIRSMDVVHSFWVPNFGEKMDAIPGHPNNLFLKPLRKGLYSGSCAEYCGADHGLMRIVVTVVSAKEFKTWVASQLKVPGAPTDKAELHGQQMFMTNSCIQCHTIKGTKAQGNVGPDLSHLGDRQTLGSGLIPNNVENAAQWIIDPQRFKPGCHMPKMRVSHEDARDIALYLENLK